MFKYNEWSDLKNSTALVKPLSKTDDSRILCLNENEEECYYLFSDFDTKKKVEERTSTSIEEVIQSLIDDSIYDGSELPNKEDEDVPDDDNPDPDDPNPDPDNPDPDNPDPDNPDDPDDPNPKPDPKPDEDKEGFLYDKELLLKLKYKKGIFYKDNIV